MALAKTGPMDKAEMRVVEGVFHQAQSRGLPFLVELRNAPEPGCAVFFKLRNPGQWLGGEAHPHITVAIFGMKVPRTGARAAQLRCEFGLLRNLDALAIEAVVPAVIATHQRITVDPAGREARSAMLAAVFECANRAGGIAPEHNVLTKILQADRLFLHVIGGDQRIPETLQNGLLGLQHSKNSLQEPSGPAPAAGCLKR